MIPVLVWKYDRQPIRVTMPMYAVNRDYALNSDDHDFPRDGNAMEPLTMTFETACMVMREWMA